MGLGAGLEDAHSRVGPPQSIKVGASHASASSSKLKQRAQAARVMAGALWWQQRQEWGCGSIPVAGALRMMCCHARQ